MSKPLEDALSGVENRVESFFGLPDVSREEKKSLDILEFIGKYLPDVNLYQSEKTILRLFYSLELDKADEKEIEWLKNAKGVNILRTPKRELTLCCGRRSGKSTLTAIIIVFELYLMHQFDDPYVKFKILRDYHLDILCCSSSDEQAKDLQDKIRAIIRNVEYFNSFIDTLDKAKEIRIFTRRDLRKGIKQGSLHIVSKHSLSRTVRGFLAYCVVMDELAHFIDNKGNFSGGAMYQALTPSVKSFGTYGKIFSMSSPLAESGKFYELSQQAEKIESMLYVNYATWEFNPNITKELLDDEFKKDPESAEMEYGARFGARVAGFLPPEKIDEMIDEKMGIQLVGNPSRIYGVCVDPSKNLDRYAVAWGHVEWDMIKGEKEKVVIIDGLKVWEAEKFKTPEGKWAIKNVDIESVENFIINMKARRMFNIGIIAYDQYQSQASIQKFQKLGMNAQETTFTNKYKELIYGTLKTCLLTGTIRCYGRDMPDSDTLTIARAELKSLQRTLNGKTVHIGHPTYGRIKTDDLADCIANLSHLLITSGTPSGKMHAISHVKPIVLRSGIG